MVILGHILCFSKNISAVINNYIKKQYTAAKILYNLCIVLLYKSFCRKKEDF